MVSGRTAGGDSCIQFALFLDSDLAYEELDGGGVVRVGVGGLECLPDGLKAGLGSVFIRTGGGSHETWICASALAHFVVDLGDGALEEMAERDGWKLGGRCRVRVFEQGGELLSEVLCEGGPSATTFNAGGFQRACVLEVSGYSFSGPPELVGEQMANIEQAVENSRRGNRAERRARKSKDARAAGYDG